MSAIDPADLARIDGRIANVKAHGPAWAEGTPRTPTAARAILDEVEPQHAMSDRVYWLMQRTLRWVDDAPLEEWAARWREEPVPPLCTLRARCEASGAVIVVGVATRYTTWAERYGALSPVRERLEINNPLGRQPLGGDPLGPEGGERQPRRDHAGPYDEPRGWCAGLAGD